MIDRNKPGETRHQSKVPTHLVICPGLHDRTLSDRFLTCLPQLLPTSLLPSETYAPFCGSSVWSYLVRHCDPEAALILIGFSAGAVGAIGAAQLWQLQGRPVAAGILVDGWGVPLLDEPWGSFPCHRISHDAFTHWSSAWLGGAGHDRFYADPPVDHLDLWQAPDRAEGWWVSPSIAPWVSSNVGEPGVRITAIGFITHLLERYGHAGQT